MSKTTLLIVCLFSLLNFSLLKVEKSLRDLKTITTYYDPVACPTGCKECTKKVGEDIYCNTAADGFRIADDGKLVACAAGCKSCDANTCKEADNNYYLDNGTPKACIANCKDCTGPSIDNCTQAANGWYIKTIPGTGGSPVPTKDIVQCGISNCEHCEEDAGGNPVCKEAADGYRLTSSGTEACSNSKCEHCDADKNQCEEVNDLLCQFCGIVNGNIITCKAGCKNCETAGECGEAATGYTIEYSEYKKKKRYKKAFIAFLVLFIIFLIAFIIGLVLLLRKNSGSSSYTENEVTVKNI